MWFNSANKSTKKCTVSFCIFVSFIFFLKINYCFKTNRCTNCFVLYDYFICRCDWEAILNKDPSNFVKKMMKIWLGKEGVVILDSNVLNDIVDVKSVVKTVRQMIEMLNVTN